MAERILPTTVPARLDAAALAELERFLDELLRAAGPATLAHFRKAVAITDKREG